MATLEVPSKLYHVTSAFVSMHIFVTKFNKKNPSTILV